MSSTPNTSDNPNTNTNNIVKATKLPKVTAESKMCRDKLCDDFPSLFVDDINFYFVGNKYGTKIDGSN